MKKVFQTSFLVLTVAYLAACGVEVKNNDGEKEESVIAKTVVGKSADSIYINERRILNGPLKLQGARIFLGPDADIQTKEYSLEIECTELVSEGGTIRNFTDEDRAGIEQWGRDGGTIKIKTDSAKGILNIRLRGESGGAGRPGLIVPGYSGCPGSDGKKGGNAGSLFAIFGDSSQLQLQTRNTGGLLGPAGRRGSATKANPNAIQTCGMENPDGKDAIDGSPGIVCVKQSQSSDLICNK